jgi:LysM repeat protein
MRLLPFALSRVAPYKLCAAFSVCSLAAGCGTASGPGSFTTASLPPRPVEGMAGTIRTAYAQPSAVGAPMARRASGPAQPYQWNGNRERIQVGTAAPGLARNDTPQLAAAAPSLTWKASPRAATASEPKASIQPVPAVSHDIIVGPGDTLFSIASKHNVSMSSLMQTNHLSSPTLKVSQHLVLPAAVR